MFPCLKYAVSLRILQKITVSLKFSLGTQGKSLIYHTDFPGNITTINHRLINKYDIHKILIKGILEREQTKKVLPLYIQPLYKGVSIILRFHC